MNMWLFDSVIRGGRAEELFLSSLSSRLPSPVELTYVTYIHVQCASVCLSIAVLSLSSLQGSPSTKILGVTRTLLTIQRESPGAKSLVFSSVSPPSCDNSLATYIVFTIFTCIGCAGNVHVSAACKFHVLSVFHICLQWMEILALIAMSLKENEVKYSFLKTAKTFQVLNCNTRRTHQSLSLLLPLS